MVILRLIFFPLTLVYLTVLFVRNKLYDWQIIGSTKFDIPVINVGNLSIGGTGKTPHIEYLSKLLLSQNLYPSILSRGYKRKTIGYVLAQPETEVFEIGDEPYQMYKKLQTVPVAVCENRVIGVPNLLYDEPQTKVVLLDDAYQHRPIKAGLNILLTPFQNPFYNDYLLPFGSLREYKQAYNRADTIVVTKCPTDLSESAKQEFIKHINPKPYQQVFFSYINYNGYKTLYSNLLVEPKTFDFVYCFAGIANIKPLETYLKSCFKEVFIRKFPDHFAYRIDDIENIVEDFNDFKGTNKLLITTEKDRVKLLNPFFEKVFSSTNICYLPIEIDFFNKEQFNAYILNYVNSAVS